MKIPDYYAAGTTPTGGTVRDSASREEDRHINPTPAYPSGQNCDLPQKIALLDSQGRHLQWLDEHAARNIIKSGHVTLLRASHRVRFLRLKEDVRSAVHAAEARTLKQLGANVGAATGDGLHAPTKYSHDHAVSETYVNDAGEIRRRHPLDANPRGCWTLKRIDKSIRSIFTAVLDDCIPATEKPKSKPAVISIDSGRTDSRRRRRRRAKKQLTIAA